MSFSVKTSLFQTMVSTAIKCSSNNKLIPITSLMNLKVKNGELSIATTDATNYFVVKYPEKVEEEDFEVSVIADTFTKLIQKTTSEEIKLSLVDGVLEVKGNGNYKLELPQDESGSPIKFPNKFEGMNIPEGKSIKKSEVNLILNYNKPSLAVSVELPSLTAYYCGEKVVTSDSFKVCESNIKLFDTPTLVSASVMELLGVFSKEEIKVYADDACLIFSTDTEKLYAPVTMKSEDFPMAAITNVLNDTFVSDCKVPRSAVQNVLDRLALFVSKYDKKVIYLTFSDKGITFSSKKSDGTELIEYTNVNNFQPYTCAIDIEMLKAQIDTQTNDDVEVYFGSSMALKMVCGKFTQIVALCVDDRLEA